VSTKEIVVSRGRGKRIWGLWFFEELIRVGGFNNERREVWGTVGSEGFGIGGRV